MAGRGPAPKADRARSNAPERGEWSSAQVVGWQHGSVPVVPDGLMPASVEAWGTWFGAWFAAHWTPQDVPGLRQLIRLYDQVERGEFARHGELRLAMDTYGVTPKGQQDRRWSPPKADPSAQPSVSAQPRKKPEGRRGAAMKVLQGGAA